MNTYTASYKGFIARDTYEKTIYANSFLEADVEANKMLRPSQIVNLRKGR